MNKEKIDKFFEVVEKTNNNLEKFNNEFQTFKKNAETIVDLTSKTFNFVKSLFGGTKVEHKYSGKEKITVDLSGVVKSSANIKKSLHNINPDEDRENIIIL